MLVDKSLGRVGLPEDQQGQQGQKAHPQGHDGTMTWKIGRVETNKRRFEERSPAHRPLSTGSLGRGVRPNKVSTYLLADGL